MFLAVWCSHVSSEYCKLFLIPETQRDFQDPISSLIWRRVRVTSLRCPFHFLALRAVYTPSGVNWGPGSDLPSWYTRFLPSIWIELGPHLYFLFLTHSTAHSHGHQYTCIYISIYSFARSFNLRPDADMYTYVWFCGTLSLLVKGNKCIFMRTDENYDRLFIHTRNRFIRVWSEIKTLTVSSEYGWGQ